MNHLLQGHVFDIFIGLFIITIGFLLTFKKKKRVEIIDTQVRMKFYIFLLLQF